MANQPQSGPALLIAGEAAAKQREYGAAVDYYAQIPEQDPAAVIGLFSAAEILLQQGRLSNAAQRLQRLLIIDPAHQLAMRRMAFVLCVSGQRWAAQSYLEKLTQKGIADRDELILLGNRNLSLSLPSPSIEFLEEDELDPFIEFAAPWPAIRSDDKAAGEPEAVLRRLTALQPEFIEAQVQLGTVLQETATTEAMQTWLSRYPKLPEISILTSRILRQSSIP